MPHVAAALQGGPVAHFAVVEVIAARVHVGVELPEVGERAPRGEPSRATEIDAIEVQSLHVAEARVGFERNAVPLHLAVFDFRAPLVLVGAREKAEIVDVEFSAGIVAIKPSQPMAAALFAQREGDRLADVTFANHVAVGHMARRAPV